jgi:hypothetical protein
MRLERLVYKHVPWLKKKVTKKPTQVWETQKKKEEKNKEKDSLPLL